MYNANVSARTVRCRNCGKRLAAATRVCPACGADQPLHVRRIRCNYCSLRVPADSAVCPHCKHDPRGFYIRPRAVLGLVGVVAIAALAYAALNPSLWVSSLTPTNTSTVTPTRIPSATAVIALVVTATLPPSLTASPTQAPTTTSTATTGPTATETPSPTATKRVVTRPLPSSTSSPTATSFPPPILVSPPNGTSFSGPKDRIIFSFTSAAPLEENQWFRLEVVFQNRTNNFANWCGWSKGGPLQFPMSYRDDSWQLDRTFRWHVNIADSPLSHPSTCAAEATIVSPPSVEWTFYWY
jgi:RNA polymerase subunit RPABC4/transcription elongation factor Spt4